jgi:stress response protein SCP2
VLKEITSYGKKRIYRGHVHLAAENRHGKGHQRAHQIEVAGSIDAETVLALFNS